MAFERVDDNCYKWLEKGYKVNTSFCLESVCGNWFSLSQQSRGLEKSRRQLLKMAGKGFRGQYLFLPGICLW